MELNTGLNLSICGGGLGSGLQFEALSQPVLAPSVALDYTVSIPAGANTERIFADHQGILRRAIADEARFEGARRVENIALIPGSWSIAVSGVGATMTEVDGLFTATITDDVGGGRAFVHATLTGSGGSGARYQISCDVVVLTGQLVFTAENFIGATLASSGAATKTTFQMLEDGGRVGRFCSVIDAHASTDMSVRFGIGGEGSARTTLDPICQVIFQNLQIEEISQGTDIVSEYINQTTDYDVGDALGVKYFLSPNRNTFNPMTRKITADNIDVVGNAGYVLSYGVNADGIVAPAADHEPGGTAVDATVGRFPGRQFLELSAGGNDNNYGVGPFDASDGLIYVSVLADPGITTENVTWWMTNDNLGLAQPRASLTVGGSVTGSFVPGQWRDIILLTDDFTDDGGMDWSDIQGMRFIKSLAGGNIKLGAVQTGMRSRPKVVLMLDDGTQAQYDNRDEFISRSLPVSWALARSIIDTGGLSSAEVATALAEGLGELICHGATDLTTLTGAPLTTEVQAIQQWASDRDGDPRLMALPSGALNAEVRDVLAAENISHARGLGGNGYVYQAHHWGDFDDPLNLVSQALTSVTAGTLVADVIIALDDAILRGAGLLINIHEIVASSPTGNEVLLADLQTLLAYIKTKVDTAEIDAVTLGNYVRDVEGVSNSTFRGYLGESAVTNECLHSMDISLFAVTLGTPIVTFGNSISPDGRMTMTKIEDDNAAAHEAKRQDHTSTITDSQQWTLSLYVLKDAVPKTTRFGYLRLEMLIGTTPLIHDCYFDTSTGETNKNGTADAANSRLVVVNGVEYWRIWVTGTNNATGNTTLRAELSPCFGANADLATFSAAAVGSIEVWGCQAELGDAPTSIIETVASAVTRAADNPLLYALGNIDTTLGSLEFDWTPYNDGDLAANSHIIGDSSSARLLYQSSVANRTSTYDGVTNNSLTEGSWTFGAMRHVKIRWNAGGSTMNHSLDAVAAVESAFDGDFAGLSNLAVLFGTTPPSAIKNLKVYSADKGEAWLAI